MATFDKALSRDLLDRILPTFGTASREHVPTWDESQKMFIGDQYISGTGNLYYKGVRFNGRIAIVEKVGLYHQWTYIDSIELYAFNGRTPELIQKVEYTKTFHNERFVRQESERLVACYLRGAMKLQGITMPDDELDRQTKGLVGECYKSFLDSDFNTRLTQIIPMLKN